MSKNLFARIPPQTFERLITYCTEQTITTGRRVSMREAVAAALQQFLDQAQPTEAPRLRT